MTGVVGIQSYAAVAGTTATTSAIQGTMVLANQAMTAAVNAVAPPGSEGASLMATLSNKANATDFGTKFAMGMTEMQMRNAAMSSYAGETAAADAAGAATVDAVQLAL